MGPALALGAMLIVSLAVLAAAMRASPRDPPSRVPSFRRAAPLILAGTLVVGGTLAVVVHAPWLVIAGVSVYAGFAIATVWRLIRLDNVSRWMTPSQRRFRLGISVVGLTWLGIVLGLLLSIAAAIANGLY